MLLSNHFMALAHAMLSPQPTMFGSTGTDHGAYIISKHVCEGCTILGAYNMCSLASSQSAASPNSALCV
jgi:hypothetical protein